MTLQLIEGFDHVSSFAKLNSKGWTLSFIGGLNFETADIQTGRVNGRCLRFYETTPSGTNEAMIAKTLPSALTQFVVGFAFKTNKLPLTGNRIFNMRVGSTRTLQVALGSTGVLHLDNSAGSGIATGTTALNVDTWYYIEVKAVINGASGSVAMHLNGAAEIATTTANIGTAGIDNIGPFYGNSADPQHSYDDIYVLNTAASPNNDYLGDVHVETLFPIADGAHLDFDPSTGTAHFSLVNENSGTYPDDDSTFVSTAILNEIDSYVYGDLSILSGAVFGLQTNLWARKDQAALRQIQALVRQGGIDYLSGVNHTLATSYIDNTRIWEVDPSTSAAWTVAGVNSAEYGVKVTT